MVPVAVPLVRTVPKTAVSWGYPHLLVRIGLSPSVFSRSVTSAVYPKRLSSQVNLQRRVTSRDAPDRRSIKSFPIPVPEVEKPDS